MNGVYGRLVLAHDAYDMSEYYCIIIDNGNIFAKIEEKTLLNHDMIQRPNYKNNLCLFCNGDSNSEPILLLYENCA